MAKLFSVNQKKKTFVFTSYENDKTENPAKIIFLRFPLPDEFFTKLDTKDILDGVEIESLSKKSSKAKLQEKLAENFINNLWAKKTDFKVFFDECVERIEGLEYENQSIESVSDFFEKLPPEASYAIASEAFNYASERDEFSMGK